ncbi:hypothetical protein F441_21174 [Phytophthora nicotianae CJ01A1]|uniref:Uncharacterized protein n=2 Tax=Phytophthora nicotianae TaxID=4792 RepID=W2FQG8_PHYNI|nr:hypothetical protein L915_20687 [Phytophthora nicotianae]ETL25624.1 hypothetical protein L916_20552 [Phytophthora nicotianae]ETP01606.1 hypothetical protein F441_21174 [Phytophthora nicotianae CJ01A1]
MRPVVGFLASLLLFSMVLASSVSLQNQEIPNSQQAQLQNLFRPLFVRFLLTGKAMQIHGQSSFDVFAKPVVSPDATSVRYDGFTTFIDGEDEFTYILADGAAYVVGSSHSDNQATKTVRCLSSITPFDEIVAALNNLTAIPYSTVQDKPLDCVDETAYETSFGGKEFVLCQTRGEEYLFEAYSDGIMMVVEHWIGDLNISASTLTDGSKTCKTVAKATVIDSTARALLTGGIST